MASAAVLFVIGGIPGHHQQLCQFVGVSKTWPVLQECFQVGALLLAALASGFPWGVSACLSGGPGRVPSRMRREGRLLV